MKKSIVTLSLLIALTPYEIGIDENWKKILITVSGLLITVLILLPRKENTTREKKKGETSFVESNPVHKEKELIKTANEETIS
jgi:hypothetical protein